MKIRLSEIKLRNFKNYDEVEIECAQGVNCLVGKNGMGKTNFLDAIYYMCMTKSHFNIPDASIIQHHQDFFRVDALFQAFDQQEKIVVKYQRRKKKIFERDGVAYEKLAEHVGRIPVVMIAPDDTKIATEGSEGRRKFIDNTLSQIDQEYLSALIRYNKILKQRNALLKKMGEERRFNPQLLAVYNEQIKEPAQFVFEKRKEFAEVLQPVFQVMQEYISQKQESVQLTYVSPLQEKDIATLLEENQEKDRILQRTSAGIHKDDLLFEIEGRPLKRFASQGQLKSYILSLKLSQYEILRQYKEFTPILLLDDIFDKLDRFRVARLLELLVQSNFGQVFITDTNPNRVSKILSHFGGDFQQYLVEDGGIIKY